MNDRLHMYIETYYVFKGQCKFLYSSLPLTTGQYCGLLSIDFTRSVSLGVRHVENKQACMKRLK